MRQTRPVKSTINELTEFLKQHGGTASYQDYAAYRRRSQRPIGPAEGAILSNLPHLTHHISRHYKLHDKRIDTIWVLRQQSASA